MSCTPNDRVTVEIELDSDTWEKLDRMADAESITTEELCERIITEWLDMYREEDDIYNDDEDDLNTYYGEDEELE